MKAKDELFYDSLDFLLYVQACLSFEHVPQGEALRKLKPTVPTFKMYFSKCTYQRRILPPILAHKMLCSLSNKHLLYVDHYQTPFIKQKLYQLHLIYVHSC